MSVSVACAVSMLTSPAKEWFSLLGTGRRGIITRALPPSVTHLLLPFDLSTAKSCFPVLILGHTVAGSTIRVHVFFGKVPYLSIAPSPICMVVQQQLGGVPT